MFGHMRRRAMTPILLTVACVACAAAIAALPGPGANANRQADAARIVSALALVPKAVTSYDKTAGERPVKSGHKPKKAVKTAKTAKTAKAGQKSKAGQKACGRAAVVPPAALALAGTPGCAAITSMPAPIPNAVRTPAPAG
jgi:hypothetical protein